MWKDKREIATVYIITQTMHVHTSIQQTELIEKVVTWLCCREVSRGKRQMEQCAKNQDIAGTYDHSLITSAARSKVGVVLAVHSLSAAGSTYWIACESSQQVCLCVQVGPTLCP